jgi:solute carrier family 25 carnitine/acylcarnitine transporter 20/29
MLGVALMNASVFTSYKFAMSCMLSSPSDEPTLAQITLAGSTSGVFTSYAFPSVTSTSRVTEAPPLQHNHHSDRARQDPAAIVHRRLFRRFTLHTLPSPLPSSSRAVPRAPSHLASRRRLRTLLPCIRVRRKRRRLRYRTGRGESAARQGGSSRGGGERVIWIGRKSTGSFDNEGAGCWRAGGNSRMGSDVCFVLSIFLPPKLTLSSSISGSFPLDVVKTKIQSHPCPSPSTVSPPSLTSVVAATYKTAGLRGFVVGLPPTLLRAIPVNAVTFAVFELVVSTFR